MYIIIGNYINDHIYKKRKLPNSNPAGSGRMLRLAKAISMIDEKVMILSPANAASIKFNKNFIHKSERSIEENIPIQFSSTVAVPILSSFIEIISFPLLFLSVLKKKKEIKGVIIYCYYPSSLVITFFCKLLKIQVIEDLEDIVSPQWNDIYNKKLTFSLQQHLGYILMKSMLLLANKIIIPSENFLKVIPGNKKVLNISGCFDFSDEKIIQQKEHYINVLFSGLLAGEQGFELFIQALNIINNNSYIDNQYNFHISGYCTNEESIKLKIKDLRNLNINYHGYLNFQEYTNLLSSMDLCLALQNPEGRDATNKTPSKGFEYMANGKCIIVSNTGDYKKLPDTTRILLEPYSPENLARLLLLLQKNTILEYRKRAYEYAFNNWEIKNVGKRIIDFINEK